MSLVINTDKAAQKGTVALSTLLSSTPRQIGVALATHTQQSEQMGKGSKAEMNGHAPER